MSARTWEDNADEFGAIAHGREGWSLAVLVACSVNNGPRGAHVNVDMSGGKVGRDAFAARADVSVGTVSNYLTKWPQAIEAGADVPPLDQLTPADVGTFPLPSRPFNGPDGYVNTRVGGANSATKVGRNAASLASAIAEADADVLTEALGKLEPGQLSALADESSDALADKLAASELEDIAAGGRIPTKPEITARRKPDLPAGIAEVAAADKAWESVAREMTAAVGALAGYSEKYPIHADTEQAEAVKAWALALVDLIGAEVTA